MSHIERNTWLTSRGPVSYLLARTEAPKPAPTLLFLHGARDRSSDLGLLLRWAPPKLVAESAGLPYHFIGGLSARTTKDLHLPSPLRAR